MTPAEAMALVALLKAAYPRQPLEATTLKLYAEHLSEFDAPVGRVAVERVIATSRFFPTIAELREQIAAMQCDEKPEPEMAWAEVLDELRRVGHSRAPRFSCDEIHDAVRAIGGWMYLCLQPTNHADRARFVDAYRAARSRSVREAQLGLRLNGASGEAGKLLRGEVSEFGKLLGKRLRSADAKPEGER